MLRAILNKSWQQHPTRHQLYGHLPPITKTIQVRRTRHAGHCWRSRDELIRDVLLWIPTHGRAKAGRPARTYIQQLCEDKGCCPEDLPRAMNDREEWRERVRDIRATSAIWWWWWWWWWYIYMLNDYWDLNSFEEPCFTWVATIASFAIKLNPTGVRSIYCHPQADCFVVSQLFSVARRARFSKLGLKPGWLIHQLLVQQQKSKYYKMNSSQMNLNLVFSIFIL